jgi:hypothetical protein
MTKPGKKDFDLTYLLHPAQAFQRPAAVLKDPDLTTNEKRAILASWASDACAVENAPGLRRPAGAPPVSFDEVMDALKQLDGIEVKKPSYGKLMTRAQRLKAIFTSGSRAATGKPIMLGTSRNPRSRGGHGSTHSPVV